MGDGRLLDMLARSHPDAKFTGVETDASLCAQAKSLIPGNAKVANKKCEQLVPDLADDSIDMFIAVLPDPSLIDRAGESKWKEFYQQLYAKLKPGGIFRLITELTNELFEPIPDSVYQEWTQWLVSCFGSIGFEIMSQYEGSPSEYSSRCLEQFRGDPSRIRLVTLDLGKKQI